MNKYFNIYPPVIAHRGASAYAPENTMSAFIKAAQLGIRWVEFDVMQTSTGEVVVFHDDTLERTSNHSGLVYETPFSVINQLDVGSWFHATYAGERIPTLENLLMFLNQVNVSANIEIKSLPGQEEPLILKTLAIIENLSPAFQANILFSSFSLNALYLLQQHAPNALLGLLLHEWEPDWETHCENLQCASVNVFEEIMTETMAKKIKGMGKQLLCYTVNDPERAIELYRFGVDAVFSDVPDLIVASWKNKFRAI